MNRVAAGLALAALGVTGCHSSAGNGATARDAALVVARAAALHTAAGNHRATIEEARRLLALAPVPRGAHVTSRRPTALAGPALGTPATSSLVDEHRYWHVDRSVDSVWAYVQAHRPAQLQQSGTGSSAGPVGMTSEGVAWSEPNQSYAVGLQLDVSVAPDAHGRGTVIRADGMGEWLDPRPVADRAVGPRMRVTVSGGCPASDAHTVGVTNDGADLSRRLLPDARPTRALICEYAGMNGARFGLGRSATLDAANAARVADAFSQLPIAHTNGGWTSCPADDDPITVISLSYVGRPDVDLWMKANGCATVSNGFIVTAGRPDLGDWIAPLRWPA